MYTFTIPRENFNELNPDKQMIRKFISKHINMAEKLKKNLQYYEGKHEILNDKNKENKLVCNHAKDIADTASSYFIGNPVSYKAEGDIKPLTDSMEAAGADEVDGDNGLDLSIYGLAYEYIYAKSVSETYATKSQVNTVSGNVTTLTSRVSAAESKLTKDSLVTTIGSYYATQTALNTTNSNVSAAQTAANNAYNLANAKGIDYSQGKMLHTDPMFASGSNSCSAYNNSSNGTVTVTRTAKSSDNPMTGTSYELTVKTSGVASPGVGGYVQSINSRANAVFIRRIIAKIPVGYSLACAQNSMGTGYTVQWLTPTGGTGKFTEYVYKYVCGPTGTFSSGGHVYLTGAAATSASPVTWYVAYSTTFDMTAVSDAIVAQTVATQAQEKFNWIVKSGTSATDFTLTDRTASLVANAINLKGLVTFSGLDSAAQSKISTAQSTADTAKTNAATAQTTADAAKTAAANAQTTANTAKSTADTAVTNAATAQSTANTAKDNAATAQSTANTAVSNAAAAQTTANTANNRATYHYGTCSTAAATAAKVVTLSGFSLYTGATVSVKFTYANTAASPTLNVNGTGTKTICVYGAALTASSPYNWVAGATVQFVYNGSQWVMTDTSAMKAMADWCYNNDRTYINGGKIYTKSVKAAQIDVTDLFAQNINATGTITGARLLGATVSTVGTDGKPTAELSGGGLSVYTKYINEENYDALDIGRNGITFYSGYGDVSTFYESGIRVDATQKTVDIVCDSLKILKGSLTTLGSANGLTAKYINNGILVTVYVDGQFSGTIAAWGVVNLGTLPAEARPLADVYQRSYGNFAIEITTAGVVRLRNSSGNSVTQNGTVIPAIITYII